MILLQSGAIYGPVNSRRLGRSLGINVLSTKKKVCTFNCKYCQYGYTQIGHADLTSSPLYIPADQILNELAGVLPQLNPEPAYITFSGNGEATLHPEFALLVDEVNKIRDRYAPSSRTAILSNSSLVIQAAIRNAINKLDKRIMKLDCGNEQTFVKFNSPITSIKLNQIVAGLRQISRVIIQALFAGGEEGNFNQKNIKDWVGKLIKIQPQHVQIYTLDRGFPSRRIYPLTPDELNSIKSAVTSRSISAEIYI